MDSKEKSDKVQTVTSEGDMKVPREISEDEDKTLKYDSSESGSPDKTLDENADLDKEAQSQNKELTAEISSVDVEKSTKNEQKDSESIEKAIKDVSNESIEDIDEDELLKLTPEEDKDHSKQENNTLSEDLLLETSDISEKVKNICDKKDETMVLDMENGNPVETYPATMNNDEKIVNVDHRCISDQTADSPSTNVEKEQVTVNVNETKECEKRMEGIKSDKDKTSPDKMSVNPLNPSSAKDHDDKRKDINTSEQDHLDKSDKVETNNDEKQMSVNEIESATEAKALSDPESESVNRTQLKTDNTTVKTLDKIITEISTISQENSSGNEDVSNNLESVNNPNKVPGLNAVADPVQINAPKDSENKSTEEITQKNSNETEGKLLDALVSISEDSKQKGNSEATQIASENLDDVPKAALPDTSNENNAMEEDTSTKICTVRELSVGENDIIKEGTSNVVGVVQDIQNVSADVTSKIAQKSDVLKEAEKVQKDDDNLGDPIGIKIPGDEATSDNSSESNKVADGAVIDENKQITTEISNETKPAEKDNMDIDYCDNTKVIDQSDEAMTKVTDGSKQVSTEILSDISKEASSEKEDMEINSSENEAHENNKITSQNTSEITEGAKADLGKQNLINAETSSKIDKAVNKDNTGNTSKDTDKMLKEDSIDIPMQTNDKSEKQDQKTPDASDQIPKVIDDNSKDNDKITPDASDEIPKVIDDKSENNDQITPNADEIPKITDDNSGNKDQATPNATDEIPKVTVTNNENQDQMTEDASDEIPKVTDSLGLLTESSRVVEEDDDDDEENDDDDDDYDHDDESNQTPLDQSEDSNDKDKIEGLSTDDEVSSDVNVNHVLITSEAHLDVNDDSVIIKQELCPQLTEETKSANPFLEDLLQGKRKDITDGEDEPSNKKQKTDGDTISLSDGKPVQTEDEACAKIQLILAGVRGVTPLLDLDIEKVCDDLVEISDSDSDNDDYNVPEHMKIGPRGAKFLEEQLADTINEVWNNIDMDDRLQTAKDDVIKQLDHVEAESKQIDEMLRDCQRQTDALRTQVYRMFAPTIRTLPAIDIFDTPTMQVTKVHSFDSGEKEEHRRPRLARPSTKSGNKDDPAQDDDVSVVRLRSEAPPPGLPPPGRCARPALAAGAVVYAMKHAFGSWLKATVTEVYTNGATSATNQFTAFRVKFIHKVKSPVKQISGRHIAYVEPPSARLTIGARVIALCKDTDTKKEAFFSGIIAEIPNPVNNYRYLIFFDDGYAQYVRHEQTRLVYECSSSVWEEVHPFSMEFVRKYLVAYPERPMVRLHAGQCLKAEWNGKWWDTVVIKVDASLVQVYFKEDNHSEWIYRGSTRLAPLYVELAAKGRPSSRAHRATNHSNVPQKNGPYVEYTRDQKDVKANEPPTRPVASEPKRDKAEKASVSVNDQPPLSSNKTNDNVISRVVYFTPKAAVKPYKMIPHRCSAICKRTDVLPLKELKTYNPLSKPLLSGWERQLVRSTGRKRVIYRAPCGRRLRNMDELHYYLRATNSDMGVDLFDFSPTTHCLAEFELKRCHVSKKDLSLGKELVPVPCVNYYDDMLPEFCVYNTQRTPTAGVPLNLDPDFLCGCDCMDDCKDKSKCTCWKMTIEGAATIGMDTTDVGYVYKRLLEPVPSGIYECNSRCRCKSTCLNRVAQHPLQLKLQVFKTLNRGWGIRALNDVPRGAFICVYVGNLLTDATANLDGLNEGDEYLAELDYIEVVEQMKQDYEEDVPERDKILDKKGEEGEEYSSSSEEEQTSSNDNQDDDFRPNKDDLIGFDKSVHKKSLRERKSKKTEEKGKENGKEKVKKESGDDCITISDDEEVREPSRFSAPTDMRVTNFVPKYKSVRSYFGADEAVYTMDAKVQGNIGRYLNHSCSPNVFVQNVFVDTHDPRFPWVAFFALSYIRAGTELTWNYNYDIGSVSDKVLYCYCGAPNCRGRLL